MPRDENEGLLGRLKVEVKVEREGNVGGWRQLGEGSELGVLRSELGIWNEEFGMVSCKW